MPAVCSWWDFCLQLTPDGRSEKRYYSPPHGQRRLCAGVSPHPLLSPRFPLLRLRSRRNAELRGYPAWLEPRLPTETSRIKICTFDSTTPEYFLTLARHLFESAIFALVYAHVSCAQRKTIVVVAFSSVVVRRKGTIFITKKSSSTQTITAWRFKSLSHEITGSDKIRKSGGSHGGRRTSRYPIEHQL